MDIRVDLGSSVPIYLQIADRVRQLVATQALRPGEQLPTIRQLAVDLTVDPNTVSRLLDCLAALPCHACLVHEYSWARWDGGSPTALSLPMARRALAPSACHRV